MNQTTIQVPEKSAPMSLHFSDLDLVTECHLPGCYWHGHGGSARIAVDAWLSHVLDEHAYDWA